MEYTVCFEHGMYVLEDSCEKIIMMKPWWPYLPGDRVKENGNMGYKLIWRKECILEGIVVSRAKNARTLLKFPETPFFQTLVAIHYPVPSGSRVRVHLGSEGSIIVLEVKQQLRSRPTIPCIIPTVHGSPKEGLPMPRAANH